MRPRSKTSSHFLGEITLDNERNPQVVFERLMSEVRGGLSATSDLYEVFA
jgi:hypothetical protein